MHRRGFKSFQRKGRHPKIRLLFKSAYDRVGPVGEGNGACRVIDDQIDEVFDAIGIVTAK